MLDPIGRLKHRERSIHTLADKMIVKPLLNPRRLTRHHQNKDGRSEITRDKLQIPCRQDCLRKTLSMNPSPCTSNIVTSSPSGFLMRVIFQTPKDVETRSCLASSVLRCGTQIIRFWMDKLTGCAGNTPRRLETSSCFEYPKERSISPPCRAFV